MRNLKKITGTVVSTAMDKTAKVEVTSFYVHSKYGKLMKRRKNLFAHDEHNLCGVGDRVQIKFVGQMSKKKQWAVIDMLYRHPQLAGEQFPMSKLAGSAAAHPPVHPADWSHPQRAEAESAADAASR